MDEFTEDGLILEDAYDAEEDAYDSVPTVDGDEDNVIDEEDGGDQEGPEPEIINDNQAELDTNVNVKAGDRVAVMVVNGTPTVIGVMGGGDRVAALAEEAKEIAEEAAEAAGAGSQYFWHDTNGAHVAEVDQDVWDAAAAAGFSDYDPDTKPYHNILVNSLGMLLRTALKNLVSITKSSIAFFDGNGNNAENIVARFGSDGAQIGRDDGLSSYLVQDYHSITMYDRYGQRTFSVEDLRDQNGRAVVTDNFVGDGTQNSFITSLEPTGKKSVTVDGVDVTDTSVLEFVSIDHRLTGRIRLLRTPAAGAKIVFTYYTQSNYARAFTFGTRHGSKGAGSVVIGEGSTASGFSSFASNVDNAATGWFSNASGNDTTASGMRSHSEGHYTVASGADSHAEGSYATASGPVSHAEGSHTTASGAPSHAEGSNTVASGTNSHAEGHGAVASGYNSHAQNLGTIAASNDQTALGKYNIEDNADTHALIIGNGTGNSGRSNALTVGWNGNVEASGDVTDGSGNKLSSMQPLLGMGSSLVNASLSTKSIPNAAGTALGSASLTAGIWLVIGYANFVSNSSGVRIAKLSTESADISAGLPSIRVSATNGNQTAVESITILDLSSAGTAYLNVYQNSGGNLNASGYIRAFKLRNT